MVLANQGVSNGIEESNCGLGEPIGEEGGDEVSMYVHWTEYSPISSLDTTAAVFVLHFGNKCNEYCTFRVDQFQRGVSKAWAAPLCLPWNRDSLNLYSPNLRPRKHLDFLALVKLGISQGRMATSLNHVHKHINRLKGNVQINCPT